MAGTKKHAASRQKVRKSREDGQIASSKEVVHAAVLVVVMEGLIASRAYWSGALERLLIEVVDAVAAGKASWSMVVGDGMLVMLVSFAMLLVPVVLAVGTGLWMNGFLFSPKALALNFQRIDPIANAKGRFGASGLSTMGMTLVKVGIVLTVGAVMLHGELVAIASTWRTPTEALPAQVEWVLLPLIRTGEAVFVVLAVVEFVVNRVMHARQLKMDDEEMHRDYKEANGDPLVKWQMRSMARELLEHGPDASATPDVVLANPRHYAVGLLYRRGVDAAPRVLFKRTDAHARRAIDEATTAGALVVRSPAFTRALFAACESGLPVPADFVRPIAMVYRLMQELDGAGSGRVVDVQEGLLLDAVAEPGRPH